MLALTRKKGESMILNNNIEVTILDIRGDQVKIGVSAPKEVPIYRKEVYLQIQKENEEGLEKWKKCYCKEKNKQQKRPVLKL